MGLYRYYIAIMTQVEHLVKALKERQLQEGLSDLRFSSTLGVGRTTWRQIKFGIRPVGLALLKAISRTYPEFNAEIIAFLRNGSGN